MQEQVNVTVILRCKIIYGFAVLVTIVMGLGSRAYPERLPPLLAIHLGDALWAAMVYFGFRLLLTRCKLWLALVLAFGFSFVIEFSQLIQTEWLNRLRATVPGGLVLGKGFLWIDLIRYTAGIVLAYLLDRYVFTRNLRV